MKKSGLQKFNELFQGRVARKWQSQDSDPG